MLIHCTQGLKNLRKLEVINFGDCLVRSEGAEAMAETLKDGIPQLTVSIMICYLRN